MASVELDPLLSDPTRLSLVSTLAGVEWATFAWVQETVGVSASALSKQVSALSKQGYVEVEKGYVGKRPRTWLNLSEAGRDALTGHVAALQEIVAQSQASARSFPPEPGAERPR